MPQSKKVKQIQKDSASQYWSVRRILGERLKDGITQYLLDWGGTDSRTGKPYEPSWVCAYISTMLRSVKVLTGTIGA
jgi:hypothetical protein